MRTFGPLSVLLTFSLSLFLSSCGGNSQGTLQSITLSPASETPTAGESIQFVATGHFINPDSTVTPLQVQAPYKAGWSFSAPQGNTFSITQDGVATCGSTKGTAVVAAWAKLTDTEADPVCNVIAPGGAPCGSISATAKVQCPGS